MSGFVPLLKEEDYIKIEEMLEKLALKGSYSAYRDVFILRIFLYTKIPLPNLLRLKPDSLMKSETPHFGVYYWSTGKVESRFPVEKIYKDVMRYFPLKERSRYLFYDDSDTNSKITPLHIRNILEGLVLNVRDEAPDDLLRFIKQSFERAFADNVRLNNKRKELIKEIKETIKKCLDNPAPSRSERHMYICKECGGEDECVVRSIKEFMRVVSDRNKKCLECLNKNTKEEKKKKSARIARKEKQKSLPVVTKRLKGHNHSSFKERACVVCDTPYSGSVETCSPKCKTILREKRAFYKNLGLASREAELSKVRVYGQGRTEFIQVKGQNHSRKLSALHPDEISTTRDMKSTVDAKRKPLSERDSFEHDVARDAKAIIESPIGVGMGLTLDVLDELIVEAVGIHTGQKIQDSETCVKIALGI